MIESWGNRACTEPESPFFHDNVGLEKTAKKMPWNSKIKFTLCMMQRSTDMSRVIQIAQSMAINAKSFSLLQFTLYLYIHIRRL